MTYFISLNIRALLIFIHTLLWTAIGMITVFLDPTGRFYMYLARVGWARQIMWLGGISLTVKGLENIDKNSSYVLCANHQSQIDIPILYAGLPIPFRFLAKTSLFYIPIFGWSLFLARYIPITRGKGKKSRRSVERAAQRVRRGPSLAIFPEGTRSGDGKIHEFKSGAFVIAIKGSVPVLPIAIRGSFRVAPKSALRVIPNPVELIIAPPIQTESLRLENKTDLKRETQALVKSMFETGEVPPTSDEYLRSLFDDQRVVQPAKRCVKNL